MQNEQNHRVLAAQIVGGYLRRHQVAPDQLPTLISTVHSALIQLGKSPAETVGEKRTPAVPIRRSVSRDHLVCLDCGWKGQMLKRHLTAAHGLSVQEYRERWGLKPDHPITAPGYSERRSTMAKHFGLGQSGRVAKSAAPPVQLTSKGRKRSREKVTSIESA